jgi:hypothetical protein
VSGRVSEVVDDFGFGGHVVSRTSGVFGRRLELTMAGCVCRLEWIEFVEIIFMNP